MNHSYAPSQSAWKQIFVLSLPRSGSTLLRLILDTHPQITCPGELSLGQLCFDLSHALSYSIGQVDTDDDAARPAIVRAEVQGIVEGFMGSYARMKKKLLWAEKTPANLEHADLLHRVFPQAAYICLHRNLLDMIRSGWESTRYGKLKYELWDCNSSLEFCIQQTRALLDFERKHPDQTIRLQYEDMVQAPVPTLTRLFNFLGLDWEPSLLDAIFSTPHDRGPGDPKAQFATRLYTSSVGRGTSHEVLAVLEKAPKHVKSALDDLLRELGYPDIDSAISEAARSTGATAAEPAIAVAQESDITNLFTQHFRTKLDCRNAKTADLKGAVKFIVRGNGGGTWTINLDSRPPSIQALDRDADCTISIKSDDLLKLAKGELNVGECYLQARLRIAGNEALAISLGHTLFT